MILTIRVVKARGVKHAQGYARDVIADLPTLTQFYATEVSLAASTNLKNAEIFCFTESSICRGMACAWSPAQEENCRVTCSFRYGSMGCRLRGSIS